MTSPTPRPWQRQLNEAPADFTAFVAYLRLKGRRAPRAVAAQTGRSMGALRRLSAQFNWSARVAAFEARLADATQHALDSVLRRQPAAAKSDFAQLREAEFQLASQVIRESHRWLNLASDPRRRPVSLPQICRLTELAFTLARRATGLPTGDEPRRRRKEDVPGYWTGPSVEEALEKIYGDKSAAAPASPDAGRADRPEPVSKPRRDELNESPIFEMAEKSGTRVTRPSDHEVLRPARPLPAASVPGGASVPARRCNRVVVQTPPPHQPPDRRAPAAQGFAGAFGGD